MGYASSAWRTCWAPASASAYTATVRMPSRRALRITRQAISPRLAMRIFWNIGERAMRLFAFPVVARVAGTPDVAEGPWAAAGVAALGVHRHRELARVRVLADLRRQLGADR